MNGQKKIAVINDIAGFGRCAASVIIPIINVMKIQTVFIPTAILSAHPQFASYYIDDYTVRMKEYIQTYKDLDLEFDGMMVGYLGSSEQFDIVIDFIKRFQKNNFVMVDPVMGDHGQLYEIYTPSMCQRMKELISYSDIITPNLTELMALLDQPYPTKIPDEKQLYEMCQTLSKQGPQCIVVTGIPINDQEIMNFVYDHGHYQTFIVSRIGKDRCGTGDVISGVIAGSYMNGYTLQESVQRAVDFTSLCIQHCEDTNIPHHYGLCIEEYLYKLGLGEKERMI